MFLVQENRRLSRAGSLGKGRRENSIHRPFPRYPSCLNPPTRPVFSRTNDMAETGTGLHLEIAFFSLSPPRQKRFNILVRVKVHAVSNRLVSTPYTLPLEKSNFFESSSSESSGTYRSEAMRNQSSAISFSVHTGTANCIMLFRYPHPVQFLDLRESKPSFEPIRPSPPCWV